MTADELKHYEVIQRRIDHLANRIASNPGRDLSYDKREMSALRWAIRVIDQGERVCQELSHVPVATLSSTRV